MSDYLLPGGAWDTFVDDLARLATFGAYEPDGQGPELGTDPASTTWWCDIGDRDPESGR